MNQSISNMPVERSFEIIDYLRNNMEYQPYSISEKWGNAYPCLYLKCLHLELHTCGWSDNESIIDELMQNQLFVMMWHTKWERGGHYYFQIIPASIGFKTVAEMAKIMKCSRQNIHKTIDRYEVIKIGDKNLMVKPKQI